MDKRIKANLSKYKNLYLFLIPAVLFAIFFHYMPIVGLLIGFKDKLNLFIYENPLEAFANANWTMQHFQTIFSDPEIISAIGNTLFISVLKIVILFPIPIFLAVMISEVKNKTFSTFVQSMVFLPHFLSWVVIVGIFQTLLRWNGPINNLFGVTTEWFELASAFPWLVVLMNGWKEIGYSSIVYVAAILAIDASLYEAAKIDGASKMTQVVRITIPMITSTIVTMLIIRLGYLMEAGFEQIQAMFQANDTLEEKWNILGTYIYQKSLGTSATKADYGLSTAVGLFNGVISLILIVSTNAISKKVANEGIW